MVTNACGDEFPSFFPDCFAQEGRIDQTDNEATRPHGMNPRKPIIWGAIAFLAVAAFSAPRIDAAEGDDQVIKEIMKTYHKAPKGVDPVSKKAADGKATAEEIQQLVEAYAKMAKSVPPKGEAASWREKTAKLHAASKELQAGKLTGLEKFREAVNCKACHSVHKPD